jgi:hypothetical protein
MKCCLFGTLVAGFVATACASSDEPTSVLVEVQSDLTVGSELTEVRIQIFDRAGGNELSSRSIALTTTPGLPAQFQLPASFALTPSEGDVTDFRLVLTGRGPLGGGAVMDLVERQAIGTFVRHRQVLLPMVLSRGCLGVSCRAATDPRSDLTCSNGECVSALTPTLDARAASTSATRASVAACGGVFEPLWESPDECP